MTRTEFDNILRENAIRKYKRDNETCNLEKYIRCYISACYYELHRKRRKPILRRTKYE